MLNCKFSVVDDHRNRSSALKFVNTDSGTFFIFTFNAFLELGITELVTDYFVAPRKNLCILDSNSFETPVRLKEYLKYIQALNDNLSVIILNEQQPNPAENRSYCPWVSGTSITKQALIKIFMRLSATKSNISDVLSFYNHCLEQQHLTMNQSIIVRLMMQGLNVKEISHRMKISPKTVYSSLRQLCLVYNQRTIFHLMHFIRKNGLIIDMRQF